MLLAGLALVITGCDSLLDLEPKQSIDEEQALATESNVEAALIGAYDSMSDFDLHGGMFMFLPDLLGDDGELNWTGTYEEPPEFWRKNILVTNGFLEDNWNDAYRTINDANNVLSALDVVTDEDRRNAIEGGAKFVRAMTYFELVRLWGKAWNDGDPSQNPGVPLVLQPTREIGEEANMPRSSVQEVYQQVISDLQDATTLLPEDNGIYADRYAAYAALSRVYLMQQNYEGAATAANEVIQSGNFELAETYAGAFNNTEDIPEYIFAVQVTPQDGDHGLNTFYASDANNGRGDVNILQEHFDLYEAGDARADFFYEDGGVQRTSKWNDDLDGNIPIFRLAEMYLTRAEANFRLGNTTAGSAIGGVAPVEDVNTVRNRANLPDLGSLTIDDILLERKLELSFEGHTLHDLKRTGRSVGTIPFDANRLVYPIPQREMETNPELTQNPGYSAS